ncbi:unnamed protein product [Coffea canephora]|uniref:Uncharacterized protein n=1 Tax=Coffea canephora TaxID=49390 RepID=A0A068U8C1_COFCA|nr:unnamed protein product [Coffea canephora]
MGSSCCSMLWCYYMLYGRLLKKKIVLRELRRQVLLGNMTCASNYKKDTSIGSTIVPAPCVHTFHSFRCLRLL